MVSLAPAPDFRLPCDASAGSASGYRVQSHLTEPDQGRSNPTRVERCAPPATVRRNSARQLLGHFTGASIPPYPRNPTNLPSISPLLPWLNPGGYPNHLQPPTSSTLSIPARGHLFPLRFSSRRSTNPPSPSRLIGESRLRSLLCRTSVPLFCCHVSQLSVDLASVSRRSLRPFCIR